MNGKRDSMTGRHTYGKLNCAIPLPARFAVVLPHLKQSRDTFISDAAAAMMQDGSSSELLDRQASAIGLCATSFVHDGMHIIMDGRLVIASASRLKEEGSACWRVEVLKFDDIRTMTFEQVDGDRQLGTLQIDWVAEEAKPVRRLLRYMDVDHFRLLKTLVDQSRGGKG